MATLDRVIEMQNQGLSETQISTQLQNEGISPQEINDSLNQAQIKNAVSPPEQIAQAPETQGMQPSQTPDMQQPITQGTEQAPTAQAPEAPGMQPAAPEVYPPQGQEMQPPQTPAQEAYPPEAQGQPPQDDFYTQTPQAYPQQDYYAPQGAMDTETISEIAEQVAIEKLNEFKKKTGDLVSFKTSIQDKVSDIDDRLKRIENSIDKLQQAVIGKIGEFGESNAMIHQDLDNLHGTVSKLMNPLVDNYKELKKLNK